MQGGRLMYVHYTDTGRLNHAATTYMWVETGCLKLYLVFSS
jgi:hypothetical protein